MEPNTEGILRISGIECRYMLPAALISKKGLKYVDIHGVLSLLQALSLDPVTRTWDPPNLLLSGPKGTGKSLLGAYLAELQGLPYLSLDCTEETRERHFKGGFVAKSGETPFIFGALSNAIQVANEVGFAMLVLEEVNALSNQMQKVVNSVTDFRRKVEIPELSLRLELAASARLWVIATMNPVVYGGSGELNEDLKSRFLELEIPYPTPEQEKHILRALSPVPLNDEMERALNFLVNIAADTRQGNLGYSLSPRDLVEVMRLLPRVGWEEAMFLVAQKFSYEDRKVVLDRIEDRTMRRPFTTLIERAAPRH